MPRKLFIFARAHWLALLIALVINGLVLTNSILHHPKIGYDVTEHLTYVQVLLSRLPTPKDTSEYFSAPLAYFLPALFDRVCVISQWKDCRGLDGKFMQALNFFLSIGITIYLWKISELLKPKNEFLKVSALAMLGILTVYYRTFSQARSEPYVAFFIVLVMFLVLKMLQAPGSIRWKDGLPLGAALGLLILSRQWGFMVFPALAILAILIFIKDKVAGWRFGRALVVSTLVAFVIGGWFYLHLYFSYGSFTAFNRPSSGFSLSNQPRSFYTATALKNLTLFKTPVRQYFDNTMLPIFYSDTWGDYWGYFTYINNDVLTYKQNRAEMIPYLGRVNLISIYPSLILLAGIAWGGWATIKVFRSPKFNAENLFLAFLVSFVLVSWLGYLWFLITYPNIPGEVTNKATYLIQVFVTLPVLAAVMMDKVRGARPLIYNLGMVALLLVFAHNLPALVTRFNWFAR